MYANTASRVRFTQSYTVGNEASIGADSQVVLEPSIDHLAYLEPCFDELRDEISSDCQFFFMIEGKLSSAHLAGADLNAVGYRTFQILRRTHEIREDRVTRLEFAV